MKTSPNLLVIISNCTFLMMIHMFLQQGINLVAQVGNLKVMGKIRAPLVVSPLKIVVTNKTNRLITNKLRK